MKNSKKIFLIGGIIVLAGIVGFNYVQQRNNNDKEKKSQDVSIEKKKETKKTPEVKKVGNIDVWIAPLDKNIKPGQAFDISIFMNTRGSKVGVFNMLLKYDPEMIAINTNDGSLNLDNGHGIIKGNDIKKYSTMLNVDKISKGIIRFAGMSVDKNKMAAGEKINLVTVHVKATDKFVPGKATIELKINELTDELGHPFNFKIISGPNSASE